MIPGWLRKVFGHKSIDGYVAWPMLLADGFAPVQRRIHGTEAAARSLRWYQPELIPGLLQTRDYATEVLRAYSAFLDGPGDLEDAVDARMQRKTVLLDEGHRFHFLIGEPALYHTLGDDRVMHQQLEYLLEAFKTPRTTIGIIPLSAEFLCPTNSFVLHDRTSAEVETISAAISVTASDEVALYERAFELLAAQAVCDDDARILIEKAAQGL
ncbi:MULTISPECIES: DUF5753 domain-containing protein [unclassified Nocardia]|uniref:DUF5753 domain-containing protein n=1 Tax=unclassified Nocardia TaxID=2637762 RepID=UPI001CE470A1|nr:MULTISPECIES: DUF5753 domain-containing protein [unclassified Nocardia]